jgi:preprotein translocase subunit SecA
MKFQHAEASALGDAAPAAPAGGRSPQPGRTPIPRNEPAVETYKRGSAKVGRNEPCPCGSGKKYKQCHGKLT